MRLSTVPPGPHVVVVVVSDDVAGEGGNGSQVVIRLDTVPPGPAVTMVVVSDAGGGVSVAYSVLVVVSLVVVVDPQPAKKAIASVSVAMKAAALKFRIKSP